MIPLLYLGARGSTSESQLGSVSLSLSQSLSGGGSSSTSGAKSGSGARSGAWSGFTGINGARSWSESWTDTIAESWCSSGER